MKSILNVIRIGNESGNYLPCLIVCPSWNEGQEGGDGALLLFLLPPKQNFYSLSKVQDEILGKERTKEGGTAWPLICIFFSFFFFSCAMYFVTSSCVTSISLFLCPFFFILFPAFLLICLSFPDFHLIPWFSSSLPLFCTKSLTTKKSAQSERNRSRRLMLILMGHKIMKRRREEKKRREEEEVNYCRNQNRPREREREREREMKKTRIDLWFIHPFIDLFSFQTSGSFRQHNRNNIVKEWKEKKREMAGDKRREKQSGIHVSLLSILCPSSFFPSIPGIQWCMFISHSFHFWRLLVAKQW